MQSYFNTVDRYVRKQLPLCLCLLLSSFLIACSDSPNAIDEQSIVKEDQASQTIVKYPKDQRDYKSLLLENGLQVVLVSDPDISTVSASLSVGVGSFQDPATQPGLAHYLEHMLFLGTGKYPEPNGFQKFIAANAGSSNAYTAADHTNYFFSVDAKKIDQALDQFSDYFKSPTFDVQFSDKERNAVNSEWSISKGQDGRVLHRLSFLNANPNHPGQQISVGNLETLRDKPDSILQQELLGFYQKYYSANIMKLVLVANLETTELEDLAVKHFSTIPNKKIAKPSVTIKGLLAENLGQNIYYSPTKAFKQLSIEFPIQSYKEDWQDKSYGYIQNLLSSEEQNTAGQYLRSNGFINALYTQVSQDHYGTDGFFRIRIDLTDKGLAEIDLVLKTVFTYIQLVEKEGVSERYFNEYQTILSNHFISSEQINASSLATSLSPKMLNYPLQNIVNHSYVYTKFNSKRILNILQSFTSDNARIWHLYEQKNLPLTIPHYEGNYRIEEISATERQTLQSADVDIALNLPPLNPLLSEGNAQIVEPRLFRPTLVVSDNHRKVWLSHPVHHKSDKGFLFAQLNTASALASLENKISSDVIFNILNNRLTSLTDRAVRANLGVKVRRSGGSNISFELTGPTEKHPELARQLMVEFTDMSIIPADFVIAKSAIKQSLLSAKKNKPYEQLFSQFSRLVLQASWTKEEQLEALQLLSLEHVQNYLTQLKEQHILRIYAFGNYSEKSVEEISQIFTIHSEEQELTVHKKSYVVPNESNKINYLEKLDHTDNAIFKGYFYPHKDAKYAAAVNVLNGFFRTEFYTQLRTKEQIGYVVGSGPSSFNEYPGFVVYVQSDHVDLTALSSRIDSFMNNYFVKLQGIGEAEITQLKQSILDQMLQKPNDFYDEAYVNYEDFIRVNQKYDSKQKRIDNLKALNKEDLINVYTDLILSGNSAKYDIRMQGTQ